MRKLEGLESSLKVLKLSYGFMFTNSIFRGTNILFRINFFFLFSLINIVKPT
jgi:hypothetical protein